MTKTNKAMAEELAQLDLSRYTLNPELEKLTAAGFIEQNGCILVATLSKMDTNAKQSDFPDRTGYECFVNSVHVDDYVDGDHLPQAMLLVNALLRLWKDNGTGSPVQAIASKDEFGATIKFHALREGEAWLASDLEKYDEAILVTDEPLRT